MTEQTLFIDEEPVDVIHAVLAEVQRAVAQGRSLDDDALLEIDRSTREQFGGVMIYCGVRTPPVTLCKLVQADLARGVSKRSIAKTYQISETTVRRYASK